MVPALLEALDPYVHEDEEETGAAEKIIQAVLPEDDKVKRAWCKLHDGLSSLQYPARRVGFFVGVFIGAKFQGASRDDLVRIGEALTVPCVQQWDRAEATEKY